MTEYIDICELDTNKYNNICNRDIITKNVIITFKQIEHINTQRGGTFERYKDKLKEIIINPDYIIEDTKHEETGLVVKKYDKNVVVVLKLNTSEDDKKNSIITIWEIKQKRLERYLLTHKILYKKE